MKQCAWAHFLEFLCVSTQRNAFYFNFIFVSFFVVWGGWAGVVITSIGFAHTHTYTCRATLLDVLLHFHTRAHTHVRNATLLGCSLALAHTHTHVMLHYWAFSFCIFCTCTQASCYATGHSLAFAHRRHATLLDVLLHLHTDVMLRYWDVLLHFTRTHTSCYATGHFFCIFCTCTQASCYATGHSLAFAHRRHATLLDVLLHLHTDVMLRYWMFSCTSTHTHVMLCYWTFSWCNDGTL